MNWNWIDRPAVFVALQAVVQFIGNEMNRKWTLGLYWTGMVLKIGQAAMDILIQSQSIDW